MDALGEDLFPRARLSHQHNGAVLGGHPLGQLHGGAELFTAADDVFKGIAGEADGGGVAGEVLQRLAGVLDALIIFLNGLFRMLKRHRTGQLTVLKNGVGGVGAGNKGAVVHRELVHPVDHRGLGAQGGHGGAHRLLQVIHVQQVPPGDVHAAGNVGDLPAGLIEIDGVGVLVVDLHAEGELIQGPGIEKLQVGVPGQQQILLSIWGGQQQIGQLRPVPHQTAAGALVGQGKHLKNFVALLHPVLTHGAIGQGGVLPAPGQAEKFLPGPDGEQDIE